LTVCSLVFAGTAPYAAAPVYDGPASRCGWLREWKKLRAHFAVLTNGFTEEKRMRKHPESMHFLAEH
jgi:hypothetical protein